MGRYRPTVPEVPLSKREPRPIWRGIGCLLIIIIPVLSYAAAVQTMPFFFDRGLVPSDLLTTPKVPSWMWLNIPVVAQIIHFLIGRYAFPAYMLLTFLYLLAFGGFFSVIYAIMYRISGPSRYGPMDAPPPKIKVKKYKR